MHCRLLTQYAIIMVQFLAGLRKKKIASGPGVKQLQHVQRCESGYHHDHNKYSIVPHFGLHS